MWENYHLVGKAACLYVRRRSQTKCHPRNAGAVLRVVEASSLVLLGAASASSFRPSFAPLFLLGGACLVALRVGRTRERMRELLAPAQASGRAAVPQRARLRVGAAALTVGEPRRAHPFAPRRAHRPPYRLT